MKNFLSIPAIILMGLMSCNSGSNSETTTSSDSAGMHTDSANIHADTSHSTMQMAEVDPLPAIPEDAKVYFKNLKNGESVSSPVKVEMAARDMSIDSAGKIRPNSGHFHLLVDAEDSIAFGTVVPKDSTHIHFGNAQKETTITLAPGKHKLVIQLADGIHRSYGSKLSDAITIDVKK
ncbi:MAG: DUF4399 domain-containing protein [Bacteroidota bacterium]|nr:DUF4399 domain-containing protein [Bacteroidota bacterium]